MLLIKTRVSSLGDECFPFVSKAAVSKLEFLLSMRKATVNNLKFSLNNHKFSLYASKTAVNKLRFSLRLFVLMLSMTKKVYQICN